jgi:DNA-binding transcriptional MerR regulator
MNINVFSKKLGCSKDTLRFYDRMGILKAKRNKNGYRIYEDEDFSLAKIIINLRKAQFTIQEIRQVIDLISQPNSKVCNEETLKMVKKKQDEFAMLSNFYQQMEHLAMEISFRIENQDTNEAIFDSIFKIGNVNKA